MQQFVERLVGAQPDERAHMELYLQQFCCYFDADFFAERFLMKLFASDQLLKSGEASVS